MKKILILLLSLQPSIFSKVIIFDAGGVLLNKNTLEAVGVIKFKNILKYFFKRPHLIAKIQDTFYYHLDRLEASDEAKNIQAKTPCHDDKGVKLPAVMVDWLLGNISAKEIRNKLIALNYEDQEIKRMVLKVSKTMLPENLSKILKLDSKMFKLALECKAYGHDVVILSNFDSETFQLFINNNQNLFKRFDKIFLSSKIHIVKPTKESFNYILAQMNCQPEDCIVIDDQKENTNVAAELKMNVIEHKDFSSTRNQLKRLAVI